MIQKLQKYFNGISIKNRLAIGIALVHGFMIILYSTDIIFRQKTLLQKNAISYSGNLTASIATNITPWVLAQDLVGLHEIVIKNKKADHIQYLSVLSKEGKVLAHSNKKLIGMYATDALSQSLLKSTAEDWKSGNPSFKILYQSSHQLNTYSPVIANDEVIAWVHLSVDLSANRSEIEGIVIEGVLYTLLAIIIGALLGLWFARALVVGLEKTKEVIQKTKRGERGHRIGLQSTDELGQVANYIDRMLEALEKKEDEQESYQQKLKEAKIEAEELHAAKTLFIANMSHELRTPLNAIIGFSEILLEKPHLFQENYLKRIHRSGASLLKIVQDILEFSKLEADKVELESLPFSLSDLLEQIIHENALSAREKNINLQLFYDQNLPDIFFGDSFRLERTLTNLVNNAIKFTEVGSVLIKVELEAVSFNKVFIRFSIKDTGIGIDSNVKNKLFQPFTQADSSTTRKYGGTGLGLIISQKLVKLMGGEIQIESSEGIGTQFFFSIPLTLPESTKSTTTSTTPPPNLKQHCILILDENHLSFEYIRAVIEPTQATLEWVKSETEALWRIQKSSSNYSLILIHIHDVASEQFHLLERLRNTNTQIPILCLSGNSHSNVKEKCLSLGCNDLIEKPFTKKQLLLAISRWV